MRIVRDTGNVSLLLPDGIDHLVDAPHTLHEAIVAGLRWLRFEELPSDEQPAKRIWLQSERMADHWSHVERMREDRYGLDRGSDDPGEAGVDYEDNDIPLIVSG